MTGPVTRQFPVASAVLMALAALPYALMLAGIGDLQAVDGIARGLVAVYAIGAAIVLWILLASLLILGGLRGYMPTLSAITAYILHPCSGLAAIASIFALSQSDSPRWLLGVPVLLPPLIAAYAFWVQIRGAQSIASSTAIDSMIWFVISILSIMPWLAIADHQLNSTTRQKQAIPYIDAEKEREEAARRDLARFGQLTPDSPLRDYLDFLKRGDDLRQRALESARRVRTRQAAAEELLREGMSVWLSDLWQLDLQPTPALCDAFADHLRKEAERDRGKDSYWVVADYLEIHLQNMRWLANENCDLGDSLAAVEATARSYPTSPQRDRFLDALGAIRRP